MFLFLFKRTLKELQPPQKYKYRKKFKGRIPVGENLSTKGTTLIHGQYGLKAMEGTILTLHQLEAVRKTVKRILNIKDLQMFLRVCPDIPRTKKAIGTRMGRGKPDVDHYIARVPQSRIVFEIGIHPMIAHLSPLSNFRIDPELLEAKEYDKQMRKYCKPTTLLKIGYQLPTPTAEQIEPWLPKIKAIEAFQQAIYKLPMKCKIINK